MTGDQAVFFTSESNRILGGRIVCRGDVTGTGTVGIAQLVQLARLLSGQATPTELILAAGDMNASGHLDIGDLTQLAAFICSGD